MSRGTSQDGSRGGNRRVLFAKELSEIARTSKLFVLPGLFLFFGLTSPILTKMLPEILKSLGGSAGGVQIILPPPTAVDSFLQFLKNLQQIGVLALILTAMGSVAEEKARGTALLVVTKPVSRAAFVAAKFWAHLLLLLAACLAGYIPAAAYTAILFPGPSLLAPSLQAMALYVVYAGLILALTIAASAAVRNQAAAGGIALGGFFALSALSALGGTWARWMPGLLPAMQNQIVSGKADWAAALPALGVTVALTAALVALGGAVFGRQEL